MLVLSRLLGESIVIGTGPDAIIVTITDVDRGKVRLGIVAPGQVVDREEVRRRKERDQRHELGGE